MELEYLVSRKALGDIKGLSFSPDGNYVATAGKGKFARILSFNKDNNGLEEALVLEHPSSVNDVCFSPNGKYFATACSDHKVRVYSFNSKRLTFEELVSEKLHGFVKSVCFSPESLFLLTVDSRRFELSNVNYSESRLDNQLSLRHDGNGTGCSFSSFNGNFAIGGNGKVSFYSLDIEDEDAKKVFFANVSGQVSDVCFSPDGKYLASASGRSVVSLIELGDNGRGHPRKLFEKKINGKVRGIVFSKDGLLLASNCIDGLQIFKANY